MHRRRFLTNTLASATALGATAALRAAGDEQPKAETTKKGRMKAGHQGRSSDADLRVLAALGVQHICSALPSPTLDENWSVAGLRRLRQRVERFGIKLDMVPLPLSNTPLGRAENPHILLGQSPERDREIDRLCRMIRN